MIQVRGWAHLYPLHTDFRPIGSHRSSGRSVIWVEFWLMHEARLCAAFSTRTRRVQALKPSKIIRVSLEKAQIRKLCISESSQFNRGSHGKWKVLNFYLMVGFPTAAFTVKPNGFLLLLVSEGSILLQKVMVFCYFLEARARPGPARAGRM